MKFDIKAADQSGTLVDITYDNMTNELFIGDQPIRRSSSTPQLYAQTYPDFTKSLTPRVIKIQLGLSCNYSCSYCSQRFIERPPATSKKDIDAFLQRLDVLDLREEAGLKIEFWGGEPLVYWKTMKPLAEAIREKYDWDNPIKFSVITNGSLLTDEISDWLYDMGFSMAVSHDGPAQHVRGEDPFLDPEKKAVLMRLYKKMKPENRISFSAMLTPGNISRKAVHNWFIDFIGDPNVNLSEGELVDAYDDGGIDASISTNAEHFEFRKTSFNDIRSNNGYIGFGGVLQKVDTFIESVLDAKNGEFTGQKCGMDRKDTLAIDLNGNVITCQNVSAVEVAPNGKSHLAGNLSDMAAVKVEGARHWSERKECTECPVLQLCKGSCMFLEDERREVSCQSSYSDNVSLFALGIEKIAGLIPVFIDSPNLPDNRKDIWGDILQHPKNTRRKTIKIVAAKTVEEGVSVYTASKVGE